VRTNTADRAKVLVTEADAKKIDDEWASLTSSPDWQYISKTYKFYVVTDEDVKNEKIKLLKKEGYERSDNDVRWALFNKKLLEYAQINSWGLYRNTIFEMAEQLRQENRLNEALRHFLQVFYLDINGPLNIDSGRKFDFFKKHRTFDPEYAMVAPAVVALIRYISSTLNIGSEDLKEIFLEINGRINKNLRLPIKPDEGWLSLNKELR